MQANEPSELAGQGQLTPNQLAPPRLSKSAVHPLNTLRRILNWIFWTRHCEPGFVNDTKSNVAQGCLE